ncbi:MAG: Uma2 family endonuclease [Planctomycetota bacterium]
MPSILENPAVRRAAVSVSVEQYHRLGRMGIIHENTELLEGVIVRKMIKSPLHSWLVQFLVESLKANVPRGFHVRQEQPLTFVGSEPEPDVAVVSGSPDDYRRAHPSKAVLVIEVAVASAAVDREKAKLYAAAGVAEYLVILPDEKCIEAYSSPSSSGYGCVCALGCGDSLRLNSVPRFELKVDDLFRDG